MAYHSSRYIEQFAFGMNNEIEMGTVFFFAQETNRSENKSDNVVADDNFEYAKSK